MSPVVSLNSQEEKQRLTVYPLEAQ